MSTEQTHATTPTNDTRRSPSCSPEAHQRAGGWQGGFSGLPMDALAVSDGVNWGALTRPHGADGGEGQSVREEEAAIVERARGILARRLRAADTVFSTPDTVRDYLMMRLAGLEYEVFGVIWLDAANALIDDELMFRGTLTQTSVYPREVVKSALKNNAASGLLYHNHPSGRGEPSVSDRTLTRVLRDALALIDVRVLDHLIVAGTAEPSSLAELGLM